MECFEVRWNFTYVEVCLFVVNDKQVCQVCEGVYIVLFFMQVYKGVFPCRDV